MHLSLPWFQKRRSARRAFSEGQIIRRMNPTRSARPPEKFALENFTFSATKLTEELYSFRRRKTISGVFTNKQMSLKCESLIMPTLAPV